ncbi:MAG: exo-alpha-sialidase [Acidobacteria bacterium]|nr:exo-alpha-sialidase [Acidobacteriota bacterium]
MRFFLFFLSSIAFSQPLDPRNIVTGTVIPDEFYADQPYVVKTNDGAWLYVITTGPGQEGAGGQHVVSLRSTDQGKTWEKAVDIEPNNGPEASYAVTLKVPSGRVYVFYNHNTDNIRRVIGDKPAYKDGWVTRVDSLGHFVFKYTDDHGRTWSKERYEIPQRDFEIDRKNPYGGKIKFFWTVGKAFAYKGAGYVPLHKVGGFGDGFFTSSEGVLLRSANIMAEPDANRIKWETLPEGDKGIRTPPGGGTIAEEHSFSVMSDGSIFCVFRTIDGHAAHTYSRDGGRTWEPSQYMRFADGRLMKHPRAANFAWRAENGKYLYWFHNHGGRFIREHPRQRTNAYEERNPVWLSGGVEADGPTGKIIRWSQPEIALYDDDPIIRMSYPDLVEDGGNYYLTETQKDVARVHKIDPVLLDGLWGSAARPAPDKAAADVVFYQRSKRADHGKEDLRASFSLDLWVNLPNLEAGQTLLSGAGLTLRTIAGGAVELALTDGRSESRWASDPGSVAAGKPQHIVVIVDGGPKIISFLTNGQFNDGGEHRQYGWGRFSPNLKTVMGLGELNRSPVVLKLGVFNRYLRTAEAIASFRAGPQ